MSSSTGMSGAQSVTPKMFSWSYPHDNKIVLIQNMALTIEDSRDMVSAELKKLKPEWDSSKFDKRRHNVRSLNLAAIPNFQPWTISVQVVDKEEKVLLTTEIARKAALIKRQPRSIESPKEGTNALKFFSFVYRESGDGVGSNQISYNICVVDLDPITARKLINDNMGQYSDGVLTKLQATGTVSLLSQGVQMKFEYQQARIASVTRVTNLTQVAVLMYDGNTKFTRPQPQTPYKMSKEQRKRHNMAEHAKLHPNTPYVPPVQRTAPVRDSTGAPV